MCQDPLVLFADGAFGLILLGLWIFCVIDAITNDASAVRNLPKPVWIMLVLLLPDIGSIAWLVAGRPWNGQVLNAGRAGGRSEQFPEYERPGRHVAADPAEDERFLAQVRERAEAQRSEYAARRKAELEQEQRRLLRGEDDAAES